MIKYYKIKDRKTGEIGVVGVNCNPTHRITINKESSEYKELKSMPIFGDAILWHRITEKEFYEFISTTKPSGVAV